MKTGVKSICVLVAVILTGILIGCSSGERYIVHHSNGTVLDTKTNLMWAAKDNGSDVSWKDAKSYCESFSAGGYQDWRLPTTDELAGLYDSEKSRQAPCAGNFGLHVGPESISITCLAVWASETKGDDALQFNFVYGNSSPYLKSHTYATRALPVRTNK